jgi:hypothetical protein
MRGLFHFHLAVYFAPIPTSGSPNTNGIVLSDKVFDIDYIGKRASLDDTYEFIVSDFTKAIESGLNKERNTGHLNYWAALALRARANLYRGEYAAALADAQEVMSDSPYKLSTIENYTSMWSREGADEVLFEYLQTDVYNAQRYSPGYYTSPLGYSEYGVSEAFYNWLMLNPLDVRSKMVANCMQAPESEPDYHVGYYPLKYPGNAGASVAVYASNIRVVRLSEMYLIAAEAALKTGEEAAGYMNRLRANRIEGYVDVTSVTLDDILDERRKELFLEGDRWYELKRNGRPEFWAAKDGYKRTTRRFMYTFPLPIQDVELVDGLIQNPGYDKVQ